tara:strand:+ start:309 stop:593 length:285 start_codon:yes stop_codon:yes gene_type:complete
VIISCFINAGNKMVNVKFISYLDQLIHASKSCDVNLKTAIIESGLGDCTYYRWMNQTTTPNEGKARKVYDTIKNLSEINGSVKIYKTENETFNK